MGEKLKKYSGRVVYIPLLSGKKYSLYIGTFYSHLKSITLFEIINGGTDFSTRRRINIDEELPMFLTKKGAENCINKLKSFSIN